MKHWSVWLAKTQVTETFTFAQKDIQIAIWFFYSVYNVETQTPPDTQWRCDGEQPANTTEEVL